ncbi:MAG: hypothetical protein K6G10_05715 [Butyrivibrio sp.]|nr:hypothetical protein [Butyrivibrio sp.]
MNNFVDLAKTRRSVRSYNGKKPDPILLKELMTFAESITNPYDIDVRFVFMDAEEHGISSPVLTGEKMYVSAVVKKQPHAEEAYGYSFEKLLMRAHELGLGMVWIGRTITKDTMKFEDLFSIEYQKQSRVI